jgi:hypothetical protein
VELEALQMHVKHQAARKSGGVSAYEFVVPIMQKQRQRYSACQKWGKDGLVRYIYSKVKHMRQEDPVILRTT